MIVSEDTKICGDELLDGNELWTPRGSPGCRLGRHSYPLQHLSEQSLALHEGNGLYAEGVCQAFQNINRWRVLLALNHADVVAVKTRKVGKLLLREPACEPQPPYVSGHDSPQFHGGSAAYRQGAIHLVY